MLPLATVKRQGKQQITSRRYVSVSATAEGTAAHAGLWHSQLAHVAVPHAFEVHRAVCIAANEKLDLRRGTESVRGVSNRIRSECWGSKV